MDNLHSSLTRLKEIWSLWTYEAIGTLGEVILENVGAKKKHTGSEKGRGLTPLMVIFT